MLYMSTQRSLSGIMKQCGIVVVQISWSRMWWSMKSRQVGLKMVVSVRSEAKSVLTVSTGWERAVLISRD